MVGKRSSNSAKIRSYIHTRYKLGIKAKEIYHEICDAYGTNEVSYTTVTRWIRRIKKGVNSVFSTFVTGDETWVHFFEPQRKVNNKIWATKNARRPSIAKRLQSSK